MAITDTQKRLVQQSFKLVEPIADQAADIFYSKLFEYDPALRPLFKTDLKTQGKKLMQTLKVAVESLNDLDGLIPVLEQLAKRHVKYGVKPEDYTPVGNALLYTLKVGLGERWTPELRQAWVDTFRTVATVMKAAH